MSVFRNEKYTTTKEGNLIRHALMHTYRLTSKCTCHSRSKTGWFFFSPSLHFCQIAVPPWAKKYRQYTEKKNEGIENSFFFYSPSSVNSPLSCPLISSLTLSTHSWGMFGGPVHILFAQCIPAGSLFMSISPLIRVRLPTRFLWVKEPTCEAAARALDSWESLPSINMAKLFLHMANYLCKVILAGGWFPDIWVGYSAQMVLPAPGVSFHFVFPPSFLSRLLFFVRVKGRPRLNAWAE